MATTTNYSWTTPDDTALVKDGAAAIRTLGSSVDTTTKALNPSTTLGDIEYRSSTANTNTRLALGTAGQVLTVNSGANAPEWAAVSATSMTLLASGSVGSSGIDLTSISSSYEILILKIIDIDMGATNGVIGFRFNNDSAGNYYAINTIASNGTVVTEAKNAQTITQINYGDYSTTANGAIVILRLPNYKDATGFKLFDIIAGATTTIPTQDSAQSVGHWKNENAINRIYFGGVGAQTFDAGATYQLFGVK